MPFLLNNIRGALKGVMAWMFAIVGIAAFSVIGVPQLSSFNQKPPIKVGNISIGQQELVDAFNQQIRIQQQQSGRAFSREEALSTGVPQRVIQSLTSRAVIEIEANKLNLAMPRSLVREILSRNELFQNKLTGKFDEQVLSNILQQAQMTPRQFDEQIREDLVQQTLIEAVSAGSDAPRALTDIHLARQTERRQVSWLSITEAMAGDAMEPTPEELQIWYAENPDHFTSDEFRTISIAFLRKTDFQEGLSIPEEELRETYDTNKERLYDSPEKRTLYQLTYETDTEATAAAAALREGKPFESLALERGLSIEAVTQTQALQSDIVDTAVAEAAFAEGLEAGAILDPVAGLFGSTIVQIVDVTQATSRSFEDVRSEIETALLARQTQKLVYEALEKIEEARDEGSSLAQAAENAGISLQTFGPVDRLSFTPGGAILDDIPGEALTEAFAIDEGSDGSEAIELADGKDYLILSVDEIIDPALKPFTDVAQEVETEWRNNERRDRIAATVDTIVERMAGGETLETIAEGFERAPIREALDLTNPGHDTISETLHEKIFKANKNDVVTGNSRSSSVQVVAEIRDINFVRGSINPLQLQNYRQFIGIQLNQELLNAYITTLQEDYDVEINQTLVDRIFSIDGS